MTVALIAVAGGLAMPSAGRLGPEAVAMAHDPVAHSLREALKDDPGGEIAAFYRARGYRPVWVRGGRLAPQADRFLHRLDDAAADGLDAADYRLDALAAAMRAARPGDLAALAQADLVLTRTFAAWACDLHTPKQAAQLLIADPAVAPPPHDTANLLRALASAPSLTAGIAAAERMNPTYETYRAALRQALRARDATRAALLRPNLERARALPTDLGRRYVWVNVPVQQLELWQEGRLVDSMPVVVGKRSQPTPMLAGLIRFVVRNPYWHVPPDLAAERIAPAVLREGPVALATQDLEPVSDFSQSAAPIDAATIDWRSVAAGRQKVYLRQAPGPHNMMGQVKFMFPNPLGVYLHDTPLRGFFANARRTESAGCVRLSDAPRLARWLMGDGFDLVGSGAPEERVDLARPVPVYLVYFTARPTPEGIERWPDIYGRDDAYSGEPARL